MKINAETKAYITQLTEDLRIFLTPTGEVEVKTKSMVKELARMKSQEESTEEIEKLTHCVEFIVRDQGAEIKLKGFGMSLEEAAKQAKEAAFKYLGEITNEAISTADRNNEINALLNKSNTIH